MKKALFISGTTIGILFSIWDSMMNDADSAPLDNDFGIEIISWQFFIQKTLIYAVIGFCSGWLLNFIIKKLQKKRL